jgi:uncharacterized protein (DUF2062 family)
VFRRRNPLPLVQRLKGWLWPHIGWRRLGRYVVMRLIRLAGTPHSIAAGFACGAAVSFTPFVGFHTLLGAALALAVRGNLIAVVAGTLIGNPLTFPIMWLSSYELGRLLLGGMMPVTETAEAWTVAWLWDNYGRLVWPMTVGAIPLGLASGLAIYFPMTKMVTVYQQARRRRARRRSARRAARMAAGPSADTGLT